MKIVAIRCIRCCMGSCLRLIHIPEVVGSAIRIMFILLQLENYYFIAMEFLFRFILVTEHYVSNFKPLEAF